MLVASYWICWQVAHSVFAAEDRINRAMAGHTAIEKYIYRVIQKSPYKGINYLLFSYIF